MRRSFPDHFETGTTPVYSDHPGDTDEAEECLAKEPPTPEVKHSDWGWKTKVFVFFLAFFCGFFTGYQPASPCVFAFHAVYLSLLHKESRIWLRWIISVLLAFSFALASSTVIRGISGTSMLYSFGMALLIGLGIVHIEFIAAHVHFRLNSRWRYTGLLFVYPVIVGALFSIVGNFTSFGTQLSPGYELVDWLSFIQIVSVFGLSGLNVIILSISTLLAHYYVIDARNARKRRIAGIIAISLFLFTWLFGAIRLAAPAMYQKSVADLAVPAQDRILGACLLRNGTATETVLRSGFVKLVVWSEAAHGASVGVPALQQLSTQYNAAIAATQGSYMIFIDPGQTAPLFVFKKGNPAPFMDHDRSKGHPVALGRSSVIGDFNAAICFDFDNPEYMRSGVTTGLMIQPANVGGVAGLFAQVPAVFRSIENGSYLLRCASKGVSGVWDQYGRTELSALTTGDDIVMFHIPRTRDKIWTFYAHVGFVFDYILLALAGACILLYGFAVWPKIRGFLPTTTNT